MGLCLSKLRGSESVPRTFGVSPRIPSDWPSLGHVLNPNPNPVAREKAYVDWPMLGHMLNSEPIPVTRGKAYVDLCKAPLNHIDWELGRWFPQGNRGLASRGWGN